MRDRQAKQYGHKRQTRQTRQTGKQRRHTRQQDKTGPDNNTYKIARQMRQQYRQCSKIDRRSQTLNTERQTDNTDTQDRQYRETVCHQHIQQDMQDINADKTAGLTERWSEEGMTVGRKDDRTDGEGGMEARTERQRDICRKSNIQRQSGKK